MRIKKNAAALIALVCGLILAAGIAFALDVNDKVKVNWKGSWYSATILKVDNGRYYIHYDGYQSSWDEWVGPERIRGARYAPPPPEYTAGEAVMVKWKGSWYPATVLKVEKGKYFINYDGYASSWDEWVGSNRMKKK